MFAALRRVPMPLLVALLCGLGVPVLVPLLALDGGQDRVMQGVLIACDRFATPVLMAIGFSWLGRGLTGARGAAVRVATYALVAGVVLRLGLLAALTYELGVHELVPMSAVHGEAILQSALEITVAVAVGIASRRWWWCVIAAVVALADSSPYLVYEWKQAMFGGSAWIASWAVVFVHGATLLAMTALVCTDASPIEEPAPITHGLARSRLALWGLAAVTAVLAVLAIVLGASHDHGFHADVIVAMSVATIVQMACLLLLALGGLLAIRGRGDLPAPLVVVSAVLALITVWGLVGRVTTLLQRRFDELSLGPSIGNFADGHLDRDLFSAATGPLLVVMAIGGLLVAVAMGARRRGLEALHARVIVRAGVFAILALTAIIGLQVIAGTSSLTALEGEVVATMGAALAGAFVLAARVVAHAAGQLTERQPLPTAKVVS